MADYNTSINVDDYIYSRPVYITETSGQDRTNVFLRIELDSSDFNFYYARDDGKDFRLCERSNGSGCLNMFIARWDFTNKRAYLFFKLPFLAANERRKLYAFWGSRFDYGISNLDSLSECFILSDDFNTFDILKWAATAASGTAYSISNSRLNIGAGHYVYPGSTGFADVIVSGTASADSVYSSYLASNACDNNNATYWSTVFTVYYPHWWKYDFGIGLEKIIKSISFVYSISGSTPNPGRILNIQGSNNDTDWDTLSIVLTPNNSLKQIYSFNNSTSYRYYRLYWTDCWGYSGDSLGVSEIEFYEVFIPEGGAYSILRNKRSWIIEEGLFGNAGSTSTDSYYVHAWRFHDGTPTTTPLNPEGYNGFDIRLYWEGGVDRTSNFRDSGTNFTTYNGTGRGLEQTTFNYNTIAYWETTDYVYQGMKFRNTLSDYYDGWERAVLGNTEHISFQIYGEQNSSAAGVSIDWVIVRDYDLHIEPLYDLSELYVEIEYVAPQPLDFIVYGPDVTSTAYFHETTFSGADPYTMSDNIVDGVSNVLIGTPLANTVLIDFSRYGEDLTSDQYIHFDNNHVEFFNASKLSNNDLNPYGRNYWLCTVSSGTWAAIDFGVGEKISAMSVKAVPTLLNGMVKNYNIYGSDKDPRYFSGARVKLASGTLLKVTNDQPIYFNNANPYRYYIFEAVDSYGNNIALQEWQMFATGPDSIIRKTVGQLRLYPVVFESNEYYFPKYIKLLGSNDNYNWTVLTEPNLTYIPDEVIGTTDIALNKPTAAQSYDPHPNNYTPGRAVDGDDNTFWFSLAGYPQWWSVDLQGWYNIRRVRLLGRLSSDTHACELYVSSDNINWQLFYTSGTIQLMNVIDIYPLIYGRYLKVIITSGSWGYGQIATFNVYTVTNTIPDAAYASFHKTYTPFFDGTYGRWQRISIDNDKSYSIYKLECAENWGGAGAVAKIAEWEMVARTNLEARTYRIMSGINSSFTNIWPAEESTFEDPIFYATNDRFNMIGHFGLMKSSTISGSIDMVVRY